MQQSMAEQYSQDLQDQSTLHSYCQLLTVQTSFHLIMQLLAHRVGCSVGNA